MEHGVWTGKKFQAEQFESCFVEEQMTGGDGQISGQLHMVTAQQLCLKIVLKSL